jgi:hypothetical protein
MAAAAVGVGRRRRSRVTVTAQWVLPLASAPSVIGPVSRVYGALCEHDERWFLCPPTCSLLYGAAPRTTSAPDQGA